MSRWNWLVYDENDRNWCKWCVECVDGGVCIGSECILLIIEWKGVCQCVSVYECCDVLVWYERSV